MSGPYVNDDGDIWVERGSVPWPRARHEAWNVADTGWTWAAVGLVYEGIQHDVLVSDGHEMPCEAAYEAKQRGVAPTCGCCRLIQAYHFRTAEQ